MAESDWYNVWGGDKVRIVDSNIDEEFGFRVAHADRHPQMPTVTDVHGKTYSPFPYGGIELEVLDRAEVPWERGMMLTGFLRLEMIELCEQARESSLPHIHHQVFLVPGSEPNSWTVVNESGATEDDAVEVGLPGLSEYKTWAMSHGVLRFTSGEAETDLDTPPEGIDPLFYDRASLSVKLNLKVEHRFWVRRADADDERSLVSY